MPILRIPNPALKVTTQLRNESRPNRSLHKTPRRIGQPSSRIEQALRTAVVSLAKAIRAVQRNRHRDHLDVPAQHRCNRSNRRITPRLGRNHLRRIKIQPEAVQFIRSASENQYRSPSHPPHLGKASLQIRPLMHRKRRHARIEGPIAKRQSPRNSIDGHGQMIRPLRPHRCRWLNRRYSTIGRLIRASAGAHIEHRFGIAKSVHDESRDTWIRLPVARIATPNGSIIRITRAPISMPKTQPFSPQQ